jgi:integrase
LGFALEAKLGVKPRHTWDEATAKFLEETSHKRTHEWDKSMLRWFSYEGNPIVQVNTKAWRNALLRAEIHDFSWHDLRHTFAIWHREAGTPTHELQRLGGKTHSMVERYAHVAPEGLQLAASRLDSYLSSHVR